MHRLLLHQAKLQLREVQVAFRRYGCNMRTLYEVLVRKEDDTIMEDLSERLRKYGLGQLHGMLVSGDQLSSHTSHSIVTTICEDQPQPEQDEYTRNDRGTHVIAGPAVWDALFEVHSHSVYRESKKWFNLFKRIPETSSLAGWQWEVYCHGRIHRGGSYTLVQMEPDGENLVPSEHEIQTIDIEPLIPQTVKIANSSDFTCEPGVYYIPSAKDNPTFDSFFLSEKKLIVIQITVSTSHSLKAAGLAMLKRLLPAGYELYHVFVVATSSAEGFKCKASVKLQDQFPIFVLEMKDEHCEYCPPSEEI